MPMIAIVNGKEGGELTLMEGSIDRLRIQLLSLAGVPLDLTADTVTLEFYDKENRANAVSQSVSTTLTTVLAGYVAKALVAATLTMTKGTYYLFVKRIENVSSSVTFSRTPVKVVVR